MSRYQPCSKEKFLKDVEKHVMTIKHDDGLYRHIRFQEPGSSYMYFDIVTWPYHLSISGDMHDFTFSRIEDMFEFFRPHKGQLEINPSYWAEKIQAESKHGGVKGFDIDKYYDNVKAWIVNSLDLDPETPDKEIEDEFYELFSPNSEYEAYDAIISFSHPKVDFTDFWEMDCKAYTYHYTWCCYAIAYAVLKYDEVKNAVK